MTDKVVPKQYQVVWVFLERDNKFFAMRRVNTGSMDGFYQPAAGRVDDGEDFVTAAIREVKEEVGVEIKPENLQLVHVGHRTSQSSSNTTCWMDFFFKCNQWTGEPYIAEPDKSDNSCWITYDDPRFAPDLYVSQIFSKMASGQTFSTFGWNGEERVMTSKEVV